MKTNKNNFEKTIEVVGGDFVEKFWEESWTYIKTVVDVLHEPILILNKELCVIAANDPFYRLFQVESKDTENTLVYKLGNGQWNIPQLRKLLEDVLPKNTFFKGFEVDHNFPIIGRKVMILNARQIHFKEDATSKISPIILLAIEDVTAMMDVAKKLAEHTNKFETEFSEQTEKLAAQIKKLEKEINGLKKKS